MFKSATQPTAPTSADVNPTVPNAANTPTMIDPANPTAAPASPMDTYKDLWQPDASPSVEQLKLQQQAQDPARFMEAAKQLNFASIIPPDTMSAIAQGGEGATKAFAEAMNHVAQATYAQSAHATDKLVSNAMTQAEANFAAKLPELMKRHNVNDALRTENPAYNLPAAAPIIGALEQQLTKKFPNATTTEMKGMVNDYLTQFASAVSPAVPTQQAANAQGEVDWMTLLGQ